MPSRRVFLGLGFLAMIGVIGVPAVSLSLFAFFPAKPGSQDSLIIELRKGQSHSELTKTLAQAGVIESPEKFSLLGKVTRQWKRLKAGEYKVSPAMSPIEIFSVITSGVSVAHPITVREGENMYEIAADLEAKGLAKKDAVIALCRDPKLMASVGIKDPKAPSLEGYLFPDTYFFNKTMTAQDMVLQMTRKFNSVWGANEDKRAAELGMSRHEVVTLASMVEKETGAPQERPMISSVFHNRLRKRMRLQSDPTTIYGIWERYRGNLHKADLLAANDFNTYYIPALPKGPISNPGREAIQAALFPAASEFLYFVSHNDGTHQFSRSYEEHNRAVRRFQLDPKEREGKSWRDLGQQKSSDRR